MLARCQTIQKLKMKKDTVVADPRVVNDLMDASSFFAPDIFDTNWDFSIKSPSANISEDEKSYTVELAAPGLHKKDFKVVFDNKILTISAENEEEIISFILKHKPKSINIAGNRESVCKGIEVKVYNILDKIFKQLKNESSIF